MNTRIYERWNWEFDFGENPVAPRTLPAAAYAVAFFDCFGRLYDVEVNVRLSRSELYRSYYDYFCDDEGWVIEKRSRSDDGVSTIVRYSYDEDKQYVIQTAFGPDDVLPLPKKQSLKMPVNPGQFRPRPD